MTDNTPPDHELVEQLKRIRYDLTALQGKVTEALRMAAAANLETPARHFCPSCGIQFRGRLPLEEHVYHAHDGPLPTHWKRAEQIADAPAPDPAGPDIARWTHNDEPIPTPGIDPDDYSRT